MTIQVQYLSVSDLQARSDNPRTHSKKQIKQLAASISKFGWTNPILVDRQKRIVAGHGRLAAAISLNMSEVPAVQIGDLTEAEIKALVIADNRLAEKAGWDNALLAIQLEELSNLDCDFDATLTGFESVEIEGLIASQSVARPASKEDFYLQ